VRKISLVLSLGLLLSLGAVDFCPAQWEPTDGERNFPHYRFERNRSHGTPIILSEGRMPKSCETNTILGIIKDDFLVNDDTTDVCRQESPAVAMDASGNFVICWADERECWPWGGSDIYAQRYSSSGDTLGANFRVTYSGGGNPSIALNAHGDFVICWEKSKDIYAQRYSSSGDTLGTNFRVNDVGTGDQRYPSIAMDVDGGFVICWYDERNGNWDIYAQRYNSSGDTLGGNFMVNDDVGESDQKSPSISKGADGGSVICWHDERNGDWDIYAQQYNSSGEPLGVNFRVNDDVGESGQKSPSISIGVDGGFIICWADERSGDWDIYAQRYNISGDTLGSNFQVNDDQGTSSQWHPSVAMNGDGDFVICWQDGRNDYEDIYCQRYDSSGDTLGSNFRVNDDEGIIYQYAPPSIAMDGDGGFVICWEDERNGPKNPDIYVQRYNAAGDSLGGNFRVNDVGAGNQLSPSIAMDGGSDFIICWYDNRNGDLYNPDIYAQRYSSSGDRLGWNFMVNDVAGTVMHLWFPAIATDGSGNFVICWTDERNGGPDIYAQRYSSSGEPLGGNFRVNEIGSDWHWSPSIAMDTDSNFVICWEDYGHGDIYAQRYNSLGDTLGGNFRVNDVAGTRDKYCPSVSMDADGDFVICWIDERNKGDYDIYAQRYNSSGDTLDVNFRVNDDAGSSWQVYPSVAMDGDGKFVICWYDERNGNWDIYAQRYNSLGDTLGGNFRVNDVARTCYNGPPSISMDANGNYVICWEDDRNGDYDIYAQRYYSNGTPLGTNYLVNQRPDVVNPDQWYPSVAISNDQISFVWTDARRSKGWDIYAKVVTWDWDKVDEPGDDVGIPKDFALFQNYPNPFNSTTAISYQSSAVRPHRTSLKVYNILGQEVKTLVAKEQSAGDYQVLWDGRDNSGKEVSSGVYFCRLKVGKFAKTKKMVLLQ